MFKNFIPKEISWLSFNERLLQEMQDKKVPLINRIKFMGIYSSNLDEFFEVRVATLKRLALIGKKNLKAIQFDPKLILTEVKKIVFSQHDLYDRLYGNLLKELSSNNVFFINENQLNPEQKEFVDNYFNTVVRPVLFPIMVDNRFRLPSLEDRAIYLVVQMYYKNKPENKKYSIIEIPSKILNRFIILPGVRKKQYIIFLDDIIRFGLSKIYSSTGYDCFEAWDIKITRDAELDMDDDFSMSYIHKISKSLKKRKVGNPVRLGYDASMPQEMLAFILRKIQLKGDDTIIPGGRYHNFRDFIKFPDILPGKSEKPRPHVMHRDLQNSSSIISVISQKDVLLNFPYHSFDHIIDLLREASIDPKVKSIKITLYRIAKVSNVANALINAVKNRKEVIVILELQARFDEQNNIYWANVLQEEGATVIFGIPGLKVHSKLCIIEREEKNKPLKHYCIIGTGNFNGTTAQIYTDHYLLTANFQIANEISHIFEFFEKNYKVFKYKHLFVSPFTTRERLTSLINREIENASEGKPAYIDWKLNNLSDREMIDILYKASCAGVKIRLIIRGMFSLIPGVKGKSENIEARGIVDRYLEHSRVLFFCNNGDESCFISSADILQRNLNFRIEVTCPVYSSDLKQELRDIFEIQWSDNVKARVLDKEQSNRYVTDSNAKIRSQDEIYNYLKRKHEGK
ncbi:MAG: polyphosphate kinase 1 [Spirochaetes bacterium]|nr:polyphosphate kinase 1 [Spirochaetota bacterium]